ncbi:26305_t:CDS:2, partial [Racocetra persica]
VICCDDDAKPSPFFGEMPHNWLKEHADYYEEVLTDYCTKYSKLCELKKLCEHLKKEWTSLDCILSAYRLSRRIASQKCLELYHIKYPDLPKQELVKNDIVHLPLNTLPEKFIKDIWMTLEALQRVWVIDEHLAQLIRIEGLPLPPEIEEAKNKKAIE